MLPLGYVGRLTNRKYLVVWPRCVMPRKMDELAGEILMYEKDPHIKSSSCPHSCTGALGVIDHAIMPESFHASRGNPVAEAGRLQ